MTSEAVRKRLKIVILLQDLEFGGTQRYAIHLLKNLCRDKFDCEMWVLRGGMDMAPLALATDCRVRWMSYSERYVWPWALVKLLHCLVREPPDILYALTGVPNIWGRPFAKLAGVPVIITGWRSLIEKQAESILWPLSTRIVCNAQALKDMVIQRHSVNPDIVAVIPNGVDADFFCPDGNSKAAEPTAVFIGRFVKEKDPLTLVKAFQLVLRRIPSARLIMVGDGRLRQDVEAYVLKESIDRIEILPGHSDTRQLLRSAWLFAMSSIREGMPNVILEAMAMGIPVVGTRAGGIPEIVTHGRTGLLVNPSNAEELAEALTQVLSDASLRDRLGDQGREEVLQSYSIDVMIRETERLIIEAAQEKGIL